MIDYVFNPRIYAENSGTLVYFHAPKCASRTILAWLTLSEYPKLLQEQPALFDPFCLGDYPQFSRIIPEIPLCEVKERKAFCIVRDPVERFISAYSDRVLRYKREEFTAFPEISSLINNLDKLESFPVLAHHLRPMRSFYGDDLDRYHRVFSFNDLGSVKRYLEQSLSATLPELKLQSCERLEKPVLSSNETSFLRDFYAEDYRIYANFLT